MPRTSRRPRESILRRQLTRSMTLSLLLLCLWPVASGSASGIYSTQASLVMSSPSGDYIGLGRQYDYEFPSAWPAPFESWGTFGQVEIHLANFGFVDPSNYDFWALTFGSPDRVRLTPGTYTGAVRNGTRPLGTPGLDVNGEGRGCNQLTGDFTVLDVSYGPYDYLERFHATFDQSCEGFIPPPHGEVNIVNPPAPVPLQLTVGADAGHTDRDSAFVQGSVTCTQATSVTVSGSVSEQTKKGTASGTLNPVTVNCSPGAAASWNTSARRATDVTFVAGPAQVSLSGSGLDTWYSQYRQWDPAIYATDNE